jgi:hypothetical protein
MNKQKILTIIALLGLYLIVTGASYVGFGAAAGSISELTSPDVIGPSGKSKIDLNAPKTEECPINGEKYTVAERKVWETRRPIAAMIENHLDSRPQSGLSRSDAVYEAVAEGGITRFMAIYYCGASAQDVRIGPVRSSRIYFINWAAEYGDYPLYVHVGGSNNICSDCPGGVKPKGTVAKEVLALEELIRLGWREASGNALDGGANVGYPIMWRDYERIPGAATEHTFMASTDKLFAEGIRRGFGYTRTDDGAWNKKFASWKFADDQPSGSPNAQTISFGFWSNKPDYDVQWKYDQATNSYKRFSGGKEQLDMDTNQQLTAKNVVIQFVKEKGPVDKEGHMFYANIGSGDTLIFQNGLSFKGTWSKDLQSSRTIFKDDSGKEIKFVRGRIWIEALPVGNKVDYQ